MEHSLDGTALFLERHPMKRKMAGHLQFDYLSALDYLLRKYGQDDARAHAMFKVYVDFLAPAYSYSGDDRALDVIRMIMGTKSYFAFVSRYRYCFMMDCLTIMGYSSVGKARVIFEDICQFSLKRYLPPLHRLFNYLYFQGEDDTPPVLKIKYQLECLEKTRAFFKRPQRRVLVTATMSAGKSTLINALVGKRVSRTQNEACTGKIHYIHDKPYEDGFTCKWESTLDMNATGENLLSYDNSGESVDVWTHFRSFLSDKFRWCFIDTPGVNSSFNTEHLNLAHKAIEEGQYDSVLYVINGEYPGTVDDMRHLEYIFKQVPSAKVVFVINKLDRYSIKEDSIPEAISKVHADAEKVGFKEPIICPLSAYAALLAKKYLFGEAMNPDEGDEFQLMLHKFRKTGYDLSGFVDLTEADRRRRLPATRKDVGKQLLEDCYNLLATCGLLGVEKALDDR